MLFALDYVKKYIDFVYMISQDSLLTVNFGNESTSLGGGGFRLSKMKVPANKDTLGKQKYFKDNLLWYGYKYKSKWNDICLDNVKERSVYYSVSINMDPSKITFSNELEDQQQLILKLLDEFRSKIKYLSLIYEYGNGKLHWHCVINTSDYRNFIQMAREIFGKGDRAVYGKRIIPNKGETLKENIIRILAYYSKETHNVKTCYISKNAFK